MNYELLGKAANSFLFNANKTLTFPAFYVSLSLIKQTQTTSLARVDIKLNLEF
jgi:hypothetical protein